MEKCNILEIQTVVCACIAVVEKMRHKKTEFIAIRMTEKQRNAVLQFADEAETTISDAARRLIIAGIEAKGC